MEIRKAQLWAMFCLAVWLTGTVAMAIVATQNFWTIDRLLTARANSTFVTDIEKLGHDGTRELMYYFSSELNRLYFQYWNIAQMLIGLVGLWLVVRVRGADKSKWMIVAMLGIVIFLTVVITPRIISVGRSIDFVPRVPPPAGLRTFGLLHAAYTLLYGIELILGILATVWLGKLKE